MQWETDLGGHAGRRGGCMSLLPAEAGQGKEMDPPYSLQKGKLLANILTSVHQDSLWTSHLPPELE
jgi:hypothetical protein